MEYGTRTFRLPLLQSLHAILIRARGPVSSGSMIE
jgi:hypothetical protein